MNCCAGGTHAESDGDLLNNCCKTGFPITLYAEKNAGYNPMLQSNALAMTVYVYIYICTICMKIINIYHKWSLI